MTLILEFDIALHYVVQGFQPRKRNKPILDSSGRLQSSFVDVDIGDFDRG